MNQIIPYAADRSRAVANLPVALDDTGVPRAFTGSLSIDDYGTAYVAKDSSKMYVVVKTIPAAGQTKTVNLTISANDAQGNPLPPVVIPFDVEGPPPPPNATHIQVPVTFTTTSGSLYAPPADPGASTVTI